MFIDKTRILILICTFILALPLAVADDNEDMDELDLFFEEEELIEIASNQLQSADKAPAIVSVITSSEIRKSGARNLYDVLQRVPGFGASISRYGLMQTEVRGISTINSEKVKMLIDGHSVNDVLYNSSSWGFNQISLDNIKRIEIIRGPGSALHGSNAFVGVINIVTKNAEDIDGLIITASGGSFDTKRINVQVGKEFNQVDISYFADVMKTDGPAQKVSPDAVGNSGKTNLHKQNIDTGLKIKFNDFTWNTRYINRDESAYIGMLSALGDDNDFKSTHLYSELSYTHEFNENLSVSASGFFDKISKNNYVELLPEGTPFFNPADGSLLWTYVDGMIGNPSGKSEIIGAEFQLDYMPINSHLLTLGARAEKHDLYDTKHATNFHPLTFVPLPSVQDNTAIGNFIDASKTTRNIIALYIQDVWSVTDAVDITVGVRHDQYSDFGGTTNPRGALVWQLFDNWDFKALYGTAFRAPTFTELYNANNPVVEGNNDLDPETMKTTEFSLGYNANNIDARATYFNNVVDNVIKPSPIKNQNEGGIEVQGVELEADWRLDNIARFYGNYTFQDAEDSDTGNAIPDVSRHKANIGADLSLTRYFDVNFNLFGSSSRPRADGDDRPGLPKYKLLDMAIIGKSFYPGLELRASIFNLLDEDYVDPSLPDGVPNDHPRAGRSFMLDVTYRL